MIWVETLIGGVMLGGLYALFGLGLSLIFGVMRIANIAHGELAVLGAFLAFTISSTLLLPLWSVILLSASVVGLLGYALQRVVINRTIGSDPMPPLLVTFGVSVITQNTLVELYGADSRGLDAGAIATAHLDFGLFSVGWLPLGTLALSGGLFVALALALRYTDWGRVVRATSDDPEMVAMAGVNRAHVFAGVMALAAGLAALAGMLLAMRTAVTPFAGADRLLIAFEVVVIGGLGSIWASLIGGIALGVVHAIGLQLDPASGLLYGHILFVLVLLVRPSGLSGRKDAR